MSRRNLYLGGANRFYVIGQFDARMFDRGTCSVKLQEFYSLEEGMEYVGAFDVEDGRRWAFFPATIRPERPFEKL